MKTTVAFLFLAAALAGQIATLIGTGAPGLSDTQVNNPYGLVIGPDKALYWCDIDNHVVRRYDFKTKSTSIVAGTGKKGNSRAPMPATKADLDQPYEVRFDAAGNLYFVDMPNHTVRRVDKRTGTISVVAGTGERGFGGDGGFAYKAMLNQPHAIAFDRQGRLLICDIGNHRVRRVDLKTGLIETYLGNGEKKNPASGQAVAGAPLWGPRAIDVDKNGDLYLVLREGNALYKVDSSKGVYHLLTSTGLHGPKGISIGPKGSLFIADTEAHSILRWDAKEQKLERVAGSTARGDGPEGDPLMCKMARPHSVFYALPKGPLYISDSEAHRIRILP